LAVIGEGGTVTEFCHYLLAGDRGIRGRLRHPGEQEALTNVSRHAGQARAHVHLCYEPGVLTVQVDDNGKGTITPPSAQGLGLIGMRERACSLGGRLEAGPQPAVASGCGPNSPCQSPRDQSPAGR
jgi:hypothetical protein